MKKIFLVIFCFWTSISSISAQMFKEMEVKTVSSDRIYSSCGSTSYGVLVIKSPIRDLTIKLNLPSKVFSQKDNPVENEYVLCVEATDMQYIVTVAKPGFDPLKIIVKDIKPNTPQVFNVIEKIDLIAPPTAVEYNDLGKGAESRNEFSIAEGHYRNAVDAVDAENQESLKAEYLLNLGRVCMRQGKYADAALSLSRAVTYRPNSAELHHMLGTSYLELGGRDENAAFSFKNAVDLAPDNVQYRNDLQRALVAGEAKVIFEIGNSYLVDGNYNEALKYLSDAVKMDNRDTYQRKREEAEIRVKQEEHMHAATEAFKKGIDICGKIYSGDTNQKNAEKQRDLEPYIQALKHVEEAKKLRSLTPEMQESAAYYEYVYTLQSNDCDVACAYYRQYLNTYPNTPYRKEIEEAQKHCERVFRPEIGVSIAYYNLMALSGFIGVRMWGCEKFVNLHFGLQYTNFSTNYYDTSDGSKKPENNNTWQLSANQISLPLTLQLNLIPFTKALIKPYSVFVAATGQFNYNINGTCFQTTQDDFVVKTGYSGIASIGYSTNSLTFSVFCRKNFTELFNRDNIMKSDNMNSKNNYSALDKALENRLLFGISLIYSFD